MADNSTDNWFVPVAAIMSSAITGALLWFGQRVVGKAAMQTAMNDIFTKLVKELREELEQERRDNKELKGEVLQLQQQIDSLINLLRRNNIDIPVLHRKPASLSDIHELGKEVGDAGG